jgi:tRNA A37 methylthiotransferase MiaB
MDLQKTVTEERLALQTGRKADVLIERTNRRDENEWIGRTHSGRMTAIPKTPGTGPGDYLPCQVTGFRSATLVGQPEGAS